MSRNARYKVNGVSGNSYDISLTAGLSGSSHTFEMFPFSTKYGGVAIKSEDGSGRATPARTGISGSSAIAPLAARSSSSPTLRQPPSR